eukprot:TRINITY_DN4783_c0_g2_i1.p1 TRINITY_DN4783_c0_g2~~TRINITY_DN4783_c0_g2_i1.p1  ORF type:complete len:197 (-),score=27.86 TRINITY_DN4783_c0_g2_i1:27-617(-)
MAKDLLRKLLERNPSDRLSAVEALKHPWFQISRYNSPSLSPEIKTIRKCSSEISLDLGSSPSKSPNRHSVELFSMEDLTSQKQATYESFEGQGLTLTPSPTDQRLTQHLKLELVKACSESCLQEEEKGEVNHVTMRGPQKMELRSPTTRMRKLMQGFKISLLGNSNSFLIDFLTQKSSQSYIRQLKKIRGDRSRSL